MKRQTHRCDEVPSYEGRDASGQMVERCSVCKADYPGVPLAPGSGLGMDNATTTEEADRA